MKFQDEHHFKNYVRKIAESCGYEKQEFEKTKIPSILTEIYLFELKYEMEIFAIGAISLIQNFIKELKQLYHFDESQKLNDFFEIFHELTILYEQAKIICEKLEKDKIKKDFNIHNYFDKSFLKPHYELKKLVNSNNRFNYLNEQEFIPSIKFRSFIEEHVGKSGLYFLYDNDKTLMYIGKSSSLGDRILSSINARNIRGYLKVALTKTRADMHIYEPYYILKENPVLNVEFKSCDEISIEIKPLQKSKLIKILSKK